MSKKFFSLIYGDQTHLSPKSKIIPAKEISKLITAQGLIKQTEKDSLKYRQTIAEECEQLKEAARQEGYEAGFAEWTKHAAHLEKEIRAVHNEIKKMAIPLALRAAKKIVGRELEISEETTVDIVANSLKTVATHKRIVIYVNKKDLDILEKHKEKLKALFEQLESLSIRKRDDIQPGGCIIETEGGIINAQLNTKWEALEQAFASLLDSQT